MDRELSAIEMSIICSNLAQGCEKQYLFEQSRLFSELASFFKTKAVPVNDGSSSKMLDLIDKDIEVYYPYAKKMSIEKADRGLACFNLERKGNTHDPIAFITL